MIAKSGVETEIRVLGTRFVAIFRFSGEAKGRTGRVQGRKRTATGRKRRVQGRKCPAKGRKRPFDPKIIRHYKVC